MRAEVVAISTLAADPENARLHNRRNIDAVKASLARFGQTRPLVVTEDLTVIAGNGTLAAMVELGWEHAAITRVPFRDAGEARAFALADNRTGELAQWNKPVLLEALETLALDGWHLDGLGFEPHDMAALSPRERRSPAEFPAYDLDLETEHRCPECGYEWNGRPE